MSLFSDLFTNDNAEAAAKMKIEGLNTGLTNSSAALDSGFQTATGYYDRALQPFSELYKTGFDNYGKFSGTYADATGANGAEGITRAGDLFKTMPGYSGGLNTGIDTLERRAAARGDLGGGNTSADTIKFASDYDASKYKDYVSSLVPGLSSGQGMATAGAAGQAGVLGQEGSLAADIGSKKAGYNWQTATGTGNANADAEMAKQTASSNFWSALMGGANLLTKALPFDFGGGAAGKSSGNIGGTGLQGYGGLY